MNCQISKRYTKPFYLPSTSNNDSYEPSRPKLEKYIFSREAKLYHSEDKRLLINLDEKRFKQLSSQWRRETRALSSILHKTILNSSYMEIIKNGNQFLSFILKDLERGPDHWFIALERITGENPITEKELGKMDKMAEVWIKWGKEKAKI